MELENKNEYYTLATLVYAQHTYRQVKSLKTAFKDLKTYVDFFPSMLSFGSGGVKDASIYL